MSFRKYCRGMGQHELLEFLSVRLKMSKLNGLSVTLFLNIENDPYCEILGLAAAYVIPSFCKI